MATDAQRRERHRKLQDGFIVQEFLPMLEEKLRQYGEEHGIQQLGFMHDPDKWSVVTSTLTTYDQGGFFTDDNTETITRVRVYGRMKIDGEARGTLQRIDYGPESGFTGIEAAVNHAMVAIPDAEKPGAKDNAGMLRMDRIVGTGYAFEQPAPNQDKDDEIKDERIIELINLMKVYKISRKVAVECAEAAVKAHPECQDTDDLFKIAMEIYEREHMSG